MNSIVFSFALAFLAASGTSGSPVSIPRDNPYPELLHYMGSTATKEFYMTKAEINGLSADFANALHHTCPNIFFMSLASVESEEEFALIDNWLMTQFDNSTSSPMAWTSGLAFGAASKRWATTGADFNLASAVISAPWPAGGSPSPSWSWNACLSIYKRCNRPAGAPAGCFPLRTEFFYDNCTVKRQVICQRNKQ